MFLSFPPRCAAAPREATDAWQAQYKDEPYLYLLIEKTVTLRTDFSFDQKQHFVIKIQKESAQALGEISLSYDKSREEIKDISAFVTTPEGKRLPYQTIQELNPYSDYPVYTDDRIQQITMPNVVVGSTLDWQATRVVRTPLMSGNFFNTFSFSLSAPAKLIRYTLEVPDGIAVNIQNLNTKLVPRRESRHGKTVYTWEMRDKQKFKPEEFMPRADEVIEGVLLSTIPDWKTLGAWARDLFEKNIKISDELKAKVKEITDAKKSEREKIQAVIEYIQKDFRYVSMDMDFHSYEPHPTDQIFFNKYGDCKDQTLLTVAMLSQIGVQAYPALFCAETQWDPRDKLPSPRYFNHAIVAIRYEGKTCYRDVLEKGYYFDEISAHVGGAHVFVIDDKGGFFDTVRKPDPQDEAEIARRTVVIKKDGSAVVDGSASWPRSDSIQMREELKNSSEEAKSKLFARLDELYTAGGKVTKREWKGLGDDYAKLETHIQYEKTRWAEVMGDMMVFGIGGFERPVDFTAPARKYPIVFWDEKISWEHNVYRIPEGYEVANLPKNIGLKTKFAEFTRTYIAKGNTIVEDELYVIKAARVPRNEYATIKNFYNTLVELTNNRIVIRAHGAPEEKPIPQEAAPSQETKKTATIQENVSVPLPQPHKDTAGMIKDAYSLYRARHYDEAAVAFNEVLKLDPANKKAKKYLAAIEKVRARQKKEPVKEEPAPAAVTQETKEVPFSPGGAPAEGSVSAQKEKKTSSADERRARLAREKEQRETITRAFIHARSLYRARHYDEAAVAFNEVLKLDPANKKAKKYLAAIEKVRARQKKEPVKEEPAVPAPRASASRAPVQEAAAQKGTPPADESAAIKKQIAALYKQAYAYYYNRRYDAAKRMFNKIIDLDPTQRYAKAYLDRKIPARIAEQKRIKEKLQRREEQRQKKLALQAARARKQRITVDVEKLEKMEAEAEEDEKTRLTHAKRLYNAGTTAYYFRHYEEAQRDFEQAEALYPDYANTRYYLAQILRDIKREKYFQEQRQKVILEKLYHEALSLYENKKFEESRKVFKEILYLDPAQKIANAYVDKKIPAQIKARERAQEARRKAIARREAAREARMEKEKKKALEALGAEEVPDEDDEKTEDQDLTQEITRQ